MNNSVGWLSPHRAQDKLDRETTLTACSALPGPQWGPPPTSSFLPGFRVPCREGRSVMGAWSMPSLPSAKPLASSPRQQQLEIPQNDMSQQVRVGLRELYANRLGERSSQLIYRHASHKRSQRPSGKGCSQQPVTPTRGKPALAPPALQGQRSRHSATAPHYSVRATGNRQAQSNSSCRAPLPALGLGHPCRAPDSRGWPGAREEGGGRGGGGWIMAVP